MRQNAQSQGAAEAFVATKDGKTKTRGIAAENFAIIQSGFFAELASGDEMRGSGMSHIIATPT
jgi:hypothetical protein